MKKQYIIGFIIIIIVIVSTIFIVKYFKKPGQMTVIESQAMDMSVMKPPKGSIPVATEIIKRKTIETFATYSATIVPYEEQDVATKISGWIGELYVYPGDRVYKNQLLVSINAPDVNSKFQEAHFNYQSLEKEIIISKKEFQKSLAELESNKAKLKGANAEKNKMQANLTYWESEIKRQEKLYTNGAVSKEEYDNELAQYKMTLANLKKAEQEYIAMKSDLKATKISSQIAEEKIKQSENMAKSALASKNTAKTFLEYTQIRSFLNGVVTQRFLSKGSFINPGTAIFKIAQINPVRFQANVAISDIKEISMGNTVKIKTQKQPDKIFELKVTFIFPSADVSSRTTIVEAVGANYNNLFWPGEYVEMKILKSKKQDVISLPTSAIINVNEENKPFVWIVKQSTDNPSNSPSSSKLMHPSNSKLKTTVYTCVMHPEVISDKPGDCPKCGMKLVPKETSGDKKAVKVYIETGISDEERTEVLKGLNDRDEVIYMGHEYLNQDDTVYPVQWVNGSPKSLPPPPAMENISGMNHE